MNPLILVVDDEPDVEVCFASRESDGCLRLDHLLLSPALAGVCSLACSSEHKPEARAALTSINTESGKAGCVGHNGVLPSPTGGRLVG